MPAQETTMPEALRIVRLYESGLSQPQVARETGKSRKAVRTVLRQFGVAIRPDDEAFRLWLALGNRQSGNDRRSESMRRHHMERKGYGPTPEPNVSQAQRQGRRVGFCDGRATL